MPRESFRDVIDPAIPNDIKGTVEVNPIALDGGIDEGFKKNETTQMKSEDPFLWEYVNDSIRAQIEISVNPKMNALTIQTNLEGISQENEWKWDRLQPVRIDWRSDVVTARTVGGGSNESFYPPRAYTEEVRCGNLSGIEIGSPVDRGRSSDKYLPVMQTAVNAGGVLVSLEWSGEWKQQLKHDQATSTHHHKCYIPLSNLVLEPGETLQLPTAHLVFYEGDLDDGGNQFRRYVRKNICPAPKDDQLFPPVSYNGWFEGLNSLDADMVKRQVDICTEIGVEYYVIDATWFPEGFPDGVGNWHTHDAEKFPGGLESIAEYVRSQGLKFGLWFEPERANPGTYIYENHPEWFVDPPDSTTQRAHIDLSRDEVRDWMVGMVSGWVDKLDLKWIKWDYNVDPVPYWRQLDSTGKIMFEYMENLYAVFDELRSRHPDLLIENCASGGRRTDLGTLRRSHTTWMSDHTVNPHSCRYMQSGANRFLPGHLHHSAVAVPYDGWDSRWGVSEADNPPDVLRDFEILSRMLGTFGLTGDILSWPTHQTNSIQSWIEWYRERRDIFREDFYPLTQQPGRVDQPEIVQYVDYHGNKSIVYGFLPVGKAERKVILKGLNRSKQYVVKDPISDTVTEYEGAALTTEGLRVELSQETVYLRELLAQ